MNGIRQYFLSLTAAALICGVVNALFPGKGASAKLVKLISGVLLTLIALQPITRLDIENFLKEWEYEISSGEYASQEGEIIARDAMMKIIKDNCEAYILDKATELGLKITAEVKLSPDEIPSPESVRITGSVSPYARSLLQQIIADDLGIAKEDQIWTENP